MMSASALAKATPHVLGVCAMVNVLMSGQADLSPVINANTYFHFGRSSHAADVEPMDVNTAEVKIIRRPKHGSLEGNPLWAYARYLPNDGYRGRDAVVLRVQDKGQTVEIRYHIMVVEDMGAKPSDDARCKSDIWKIF
ncbi:MAG: hypothetical protein EOP38_00995 [Rubrivivax sp.]|nr:MAG: hypothetical protein EOP38_00995 [Rubrivivax sp.]